MKIIKNFYKFLLLVIIINTETYSYASLQNKIIVNVEDQIISSYELKNKIKTILFLSNQIMSQENVDLIKERALQQLIDYKLKKNEIKKYNIQSKNSNQIDNSLKNLSLRLKTDINGVEKIFKNNDLDYQIYLNELNINFGWQKLILQGYSGKISLDEKEITNELNDLVKNQSLLQEYKLGEIEILFKNNSDDQQTIIEINDQIKSIGFEKTASKYSLSTSSVDGGNIGWINSKVLSKKILDILNKMKIGEISKPIFQTDAITILKLIDKRSTQSQNLNLNKLKEEVIINKRNELLNLYSNNYLSKIKNSAFIEFK